MLENHSPIKTQGLSLENIKSCYFSKEEGRPENQSIISNHLGINSSKQQLMEGCWQDTLPSTAFSLSLFSLSRSLSFSFLASRSLHCVQNKTAILLQHCTGSYGRKDGPPTLQKIQRGRQDGQHCPPPHPDQPGRHILLRLDNQKPLWGTKEPQRYSKNRTKMKTWK